ncbi:MAG: hypothetical protein QF464_24045, partial [Myxococcota bacterium]|nr:hypothetical protein [Myxococcota bacterium]
PGSAVDMGIEGFANSVAVASKDILLVGLSPGGLQVVDISTPGSPVVVGSVAGGDVTDLAVDGNVAVFGTKAGDVQFVDISDPAAPAVIGSYDMGVDAEGASMEVFSLEISGSLAYISGLYRLDVVTIDGNQIAQVATPDVASLKMHLVGNYIYAAQSSAGLAIYELGATGIPTLVASHPVDQYVRNVRVEGTTAYLAIKLDDTADLRIWNVGNPLAPIELATYSGAGGLTASDGLAVSGGQVHLGLGSTVGIVDASCPAAQSCDASGQCVPD